MAAVPSARKLARLVAVIAVAAAPAVVATTFIAGPASAATFGPVNPAIADGVANSLRQILEEEVSTGDTVVLQAGATYTLDYCQEEAPSAQVTIGAIDIPVEVTIQGNGATIEQTCNDRVLTAYDSDINLYDVTITGGHTGSGNGGGVYAAFDAQMHGVTFLSNDAESDGGGLWVGDNATVTGSRFIDNIADSNEGCVGGGGGLAVVNASTVSGSTFVNNYTTGSCGGTDGGGGIMSQGNLSVTDSTFTSNASPNTGGGGILLGGDISSDAEGALTLTVTSSTFNQNDGALGGAILNLRSGSSITITNSTVHANTSGLDGAIAAGPGEIAGTLTLVNDTITDNTILDRELLEAGSVGGDAVRSNGTLTAQQSEVTTITADTLTSFGTVITDTTTADACFTSTTSQGYNRSSDASCGFTDGTDQQNAPDPQLGALANNGGPTMTQLPAATSPLLDVIPPAVCTAKVTVDQRGISRPQGPGCEIGSVEIEVLVPAADVVMVPRFTG